MKVLVVYYTTKLCSYRKATFIFLEKLARTIKGYYIETLYTYTHIYIYIYSKPSTVPTNELPKDRTS